MESAVEEVEEEDEEGEEAEPISRCHKHKMRPEMVINIALDTLPGPRTPNQKTDLARARVEKKPQASCENSR